MRQPRASQAIFREPRRASRNGHLDHPRPPPDHHTSVLILRSATPDDALAVATVHVRAWQEGYRGLVADDYLDALRPEDRAARYDLGASDPDRSLDHGGRARWGRVRIRDRRAMPRGRRADGRAPRAARRSIRVGHWRRESADRGRARAAACARIHGGGALGARRQRARAALLPNRRLASRRLRAHGGDLGNAHQRRPLSTRPSLTDCPTGT